MVHALVKLLPFMEQDPLYNQLNFQDIGTRQSGYGARWMAKFESRTIAQSAKGRYFWSEVIPSFVCPSADVDPYGRRGNEPLFAPAQGTYAVSMGAQRMDSWQGMCPNYPGNIFGTGPAGHGNEGRAYRVSGAFARGMWAARFRDVTDGESQVIAMGEILPGKSDHIADRGWAHFNSLWFRNRWSCQLPCCWSWGTWVFMGQCLATFEPSWVFTLQELVYLAGIQIST